MAEGKVPVIDLSGWYSGDEIRRRKVVQEVFYACEKIGFFAISGHRIEDKVVSQVWDRSREYFDKPLDYKLKVSMSKEYPYGYEHQEILHQSTRGSDCAPETYTSVHDWKETFNVCVNREDQRWPPDFPEFKDALSEYYKAMESLALDLMEIFAMSLDLPRLWFKGKFVDHLSALRVLNYPHQDVRPKSGQLRASPHSDYGSLTILAVDDAPGGLEVLNKDGSWQEVRPPSGCFIVNLGDLMARWTNDRWRSTVHRVVNPSKGFQGDTRRQSIAFFHNPQSDSLIECIPTCVAPGEAPKYPPITAGEHLFGKHGAAMS